MLEVLRLQGGRWETVTTHGGDGRLRGRAGPFEAVTIDLLEQ
jgi:hypothetical protein